MFVGFSKNIKAITNLYRPLVNSHHQQEGETVCHIRVDNDSALARSWEFLKIIFELCITIETTRGWKSTSNSKVERPIRDDHKHICIALTISGLPVALWCFARKYDAYVRRRLCNFEIGHVPYFLCHGKRIIIVQLQFWVPQELCWMLILNYLYAVPKPDGFDMGITKWLPHAACPSHKR